MIGVEVGVLMVALVRLVVNKVGALVRRFIGSCAVARLLGMTSRRFDD